MVTVSFCVPDTSSAAHMDRLKQAQRQYTTEQVLEGSVPAGKGSGIVIGRLRAYGVPATEQSNALPK